MRKFLTLLLLALLLAVSAPAFAEEWTVTKLRGAVQLLIDESWIDLKRGDIIPNERTVRTLEDGRADLQRGKEIIRLSANTQITINDEADAIRTIVRQDFGRVEVEAEVRNVEHFAVENRYLAAVVKGTHFIVTASEDSASVSVDRGAVAVESMATQRRTTIGIGQAVSVEPVADIRLSGSGELPAIFDADGAVFQAAYIDNSAPAGGGAGLAPLFAKPGLSGDATVQTAMLASPAISRGVLELRGGIGSNSARPPLLAQAAPGAAEEQPINVVTLLVGLLMGVVIGALALMFRRTV